jgi:hypothetical protein
MTDYTELKAVAERQVEAAEALSVAAVQFDPITVAVEKSKARKNAIILALIEQVEEAEERIAIHVDENNDELRFENGRLRDNLTTAKKLIEAVNQLLWVMEVSNRFGLVDVSVLAEARKVDILINDYNNPNDDPGSGGTAIRKNADVTPSGEAGPSSPGATPDQIQYFREGIEYNYRLDPTGCGNSFGEILCWEIHSNGQTFVWLAKKWNITVTFLGDIIADHCRKMETDDD